MWFAICQKGWKFVQIPVTTLRNHRMESKASKNDFSPEERIRKLEAQVTQLKNVIVKLTGQDVDSNPKKSHKKFYNP